jgi:hypothetical protein
MSSLFSVSMHRRTALTAGLLAALVLSAALIFILRDPEESRSISSRVDPPDAASSTGTVEDPRARSRFRWLRLRDPSTGKIPQGIRKKELRYAKRLPKRRSKAPSSWTFQGPGDIGGRTRALAVDRSDESTLIAGGVSGGVWRSTDGGVSWTKTTDPDQRPSITDLEQDPRPGVQNVWYAGTGEWTQFNSADGAGAFYAGNGVYKSTDGGRSWTLLSSTTTEDRRFDSVFDVVWDVEVDPSSAQSEVYAAIYGGVVRSTDGGISWAWAKTDPNQDWSAYSDVAVTPGGRVYAVLGSRGGTSGVFSSADGTSWRTITPADGWPSDFSRTEIAVSRQNPDHVWFLTKADDGDGPNGHELWLWSNGDDLWYDYTAYLPDRGGKTGTFNSQNGYDLIVAVHPDHGGTLFVGGRNLWRLDVTGSSSDASTWIGGYTSENNRFAAYEPEGSDPHHPDQHRIAFAPSGGDIMYVGSDGGVHRTTDSRAGRPDSSGDGAVTWTSLNEGYHTTQFYASCFNPDASDPTIAGGMQDNGSWFTSLQTPPSEWEELLSGDGGFCAIANNQQSSGTSRYMSLQNGKTFRLLVDERGRYGGFARVDPSGASNQLFINPYALDPSDPSVMYYPAGSVLWRNGNLEAIPLSSNSPATKNWAKLTGTDVGTRNITAVGVSRSNPEHVLYFGASDPSSNPKPARIYRLRNSASAPASMGPEDVTSEDRFPGGGYVSSIVVDPQDANRVLVTFSNYGVQSVFYTSNGGQTWTDVSGNLEEHLDGSGDGPSVRWAAILPQPGRNQTTYFVGTSIGLFATTALGGASTVWEQRAPRSIGNVVVDQVRARPSDGLVLAATHGNGLYSRMVPLPVEMEAVTAHLSDDGVELSWRVLSETNNAAFRVQRRSASSGAFQTVGTVDGRGTASSPKTYSFEDRNLPYAAETLTYRLQQVDTDGTASLSEPVTVERTRPTGVQLAAPFPNPVRDQATIRFAVPQRQPIEVTVHDVLGRRVATLKRGVVDAGRVQLALDATHLPSGTYFVRLQTEAGSQSQSMTVVR